MQKNWSGLLKVEELCVYKKGILILKKENLYNVLHIQGEALILNAVFKGGSSSNPYIPVNYFLGMDYRSSLTETQTMSSITGEPSTNGYVRQPISSTTGFTINSGAVPVKATSGLVSFTASGGNWGPVKNLFLCDVSSGTSGNLISSVYMGNDLTVTADTVVSMKFSMTLKNC